MSKFELKTIYIDLTQPPQPSPEHFSISKNNTGQQWISIGDMHGNALRMLHFLLTTGVLQVKNGVDSVAWFNQLKNAYDSYDSYGVNETLNKQSIELFDTLLNSLEKNPDSSLGIRFMGDMLADRGKSDDFTLKVLDKLDKEKIPNKIILSNHDMWFIGAFEKFIRTGQLDFPGDKNTWDPGLYNSLRGLKEVYESSKNNGTEAECKAKLQELYKSYIKKIQLLDLEIDDEGVPVIYSHAVIDPVTLNKMAKDNDVEPLPYSADGTCNIESLKLAIERQNQKIQDYLLMGAQHGLGLYNQYLLENQEGDYGSGQYVPIGEDDIKMISRCIWSRHPISSSLYVGLVPASNPMHFKNVHGHTGQTANHGPCYVNIDSDVGKAHFYARGSLRYFISSHPVMVSEPEQKDYSFSLYEMGIEGTVTFGLIGIIAAGSVGIAFLIIPGLSLFSVFSITGLSISAVAFVCAGICAVTAVVSYYRNTPEQQGMQNSCDDIAEGSPRAMGVM